MYNLKTFEEKVNSLTEDNLTILEFNGVKKPVTFICNSCNTKQTVSRGEFLLRKGKLYQCQFCHNSKEKETEKTKQKILYLVEKKTNLELINFTKVGEVATFYCKNCNHTFQRYPLRFLKNPTCPSCEGGGKNSVDKMIKQIKEKHGDEYEILNIEDYVNTRTPLKIRHKCGFIWKSSLHNLLYHNCPKCSKKTSLGEKTIKQFLDNNNIKYIWQYKEKIQEHTLFFDFYLPNEKIFIEYQGEQHYYPVKYWGGDEGFQKRCYLDRLKKEWCEENNYTLLEIPYSQFKNIDKILEGSTTILIGE